MEKNNQHSTYQKYREFWQNNLQGIEEITKTLEKHLLRLEKQYSDFDSVYNDIIYQIDVLSSLFSSYNTIKGNEYVFKLKSMLKDYKKRYTHEGIDFNALYYIHSKILELVHISMEEFPKLEHSIQFNHKKEVNESNRQSINDNMPFRWITFFRNGSWFIIPFEELHAIEYRNAEMFSSYESDNTFIKINNRLLQVKDFFTKSSFIDQGHPNYYIIVKNKNNKIKCFAANKIGKKIFANKDIVITSLKPFRKKYKISSGCIRIFGKSHIYLSMDCMI